MLVSTALPQLEAKPFASRTVALARTFGSSNERVFYTEARDNKRFLASVDPDGEAKRSHASGELTTIYEVSPDGNNFAFRQNYEAFVMPLMPGTQEVTASPSGGPLPVTKVSSGGADYIHWSNNGSALHWAIGPTLYSAQTSALYPNAPFAKDAKPAKFEPPKTGVSLVDADEIGPALGAGRVHRRADCYDGGQERRDYR